MGIKDFLDRLKNKRAKYKEYHEDMKIQEQYLERKKSANERELERYIDEDREKQIKIQLDKYRKSRKNEIEHKHQILNTKNMFEKEKARILNNKRMFGHKYHMHEGQGLFFK